MMASKQQKNTMMKKCCAANVLLGVLLATLLSSQVWAGGLYINEFGTPSMGVAGAGAQAVAADASTAFHNPAGMTHLDDPELMVAGGAFKARAKFDSDGDTPISGGDGGDAGGVAPLFGTFYTHPLGDRWRLGANLISISGAVLDYGNDWTGRYLNTEVTLLTVTFNPTIAYRVTDRLSIGGGPQVIYGELEMKLKAPPPNGDGDVKIDGDDTAFGWDVGALYELSERTRFGIIYQSEIELEFDGDLKVDPVGLDISTDTKLPLAQFVRLSGYHELNDQWALLGTVGWEDWSTMNKITISAQQGNAAIPRKWKDTYKFSAGVHYRPAQEWLFQLGFTYDTSPVDDDDRTPDMPMDRQIRYAAGVQHEWSDTVTVGGQFVYADYGKGEIDNQFLKGDYKSNDIFFLGLNANWKF
jgi:long-chain fatty acid transport protein